MKIVINKCYGGFGLSRKALERYHELKGIKIYAYDWDFKAGVNTKIPEGTEVFCPHYSNKDFGDRFEGDIPNENYISVLDIERNDPLLVQVVEEMGDKANGSHSDLNIVEIPDDVEWEIEEYDGIEWVSEKHRTWG